MPDIYEFAVPIKDDCNIDNFIIDIKMQGQMGDFFINGKNRWHFGLLLDYSDTPFLIGDPAYFKYSNDWQSELKSGENIIEYIPMRQAGSTDEQQHIKLGFILKDETLYTVEWGSNELIDNKKLIIKIFVEQEGLEGNDEPAIDDKDLKVTKLEFGEKPSE